MSEWEVNTLLEWIVSDPNIVYLVLVFGLWMAVTAAYVPGTGFIEVIALVALVGVVLLLQVLPTNWLAVLLLVLGVLSFLLIPFISQKWARIAEGGLLLQAIGGLFLFNQMSVSWLLVAATIGFSILYHRLVLLPLLAETRSQAAVIDDNGQLIGVTGRAVKTFEPIGKQFMGTVLVNGEHWTALANRQLHAGDTIIVVDRDGLQLIVQAAKHKHAPEHTEEEIEA